MYYSQLVQRIIRQELEKGIRKDAIYNSEDLVDVFKQAYEDGCLIAVNFEDSNNNFTVDVVEAKIEKVNLQFVDAPSSSQSTSAIDANKREVMAVVEKIAASYANLTFNQSNLQKLQKEILRFLCVESGFVLGKILGVRSYRCDTYHKFTVEVCIQLGNCTIDAVNFVSNRQNFERDLIGLGIYRILHGKNFNIRRLKALKIFFEEQGIRKFDISLKENGSFLVATVKEKSSVESGYSGLSVRMSADGRGFSWSAQKFFKLGFLEGDLELQKSGDTRTGTFTVCTKKCMVIGDLPLGARNSFVQNIWPAFATFTLGAHLEETNKFKALSLGELTFDPFGNVMVKFYDRSYTKSTLLLIQPSVKFYTQNCIQLSYHFKLQQSSINRVSKQVEFTINAMPKFTADEALAGKNGLKPSYRLLFVFQTSPKTFGDCIKYIVFKFGIFCTVETIEKTFSLHSGLDMRLNIMGKDFSVSLDQTEIPIKLPKVASEVQPFLIKCAVDLMKSLCFRISVNFD